MLPHSLVFFFEKECKRHIYLILRLQNVQVALCLHLYVCLLQPNFITGQKEIREGIFITTGNTHFGPSPALLVQTYYLVL